MHQNNRFKYSVNICDDIESIEVLRPYWQIYQYAPNGDIDYFLMEYKVYEGKQKPLAVSLHENGVPKVIFVGRCGYSREAVRFGFRKIDTFNLKSFIISSGGFLQAEKFNKKDIIVKLLKDFIINSDIDIIKINAMEYNSFRSEE
ncbi:MAG: hypothetical protein C4582_02615, partial [Desulfobacteraceae bacterium]